METKTLDRLSRRARFRIALEVATDQLQEKQTVRDFARSLDVTPKVIYGVLDGTITSARVERACRAYTRKWLSDLDVDDLQPIAVTADGAAPVAA